LRLVPLNNTDKLLGEEVDERHVILLTPTLPWVATRKV
jgi:hypothetical protein